MAFVAGKLKTTAWKGKDVPCLLPGQVPDAIALDIKQCPKKTRLIVKNRAILLQKGSVAGSLPVPEHVK